MDMTELYQNILRPFRSTLVLGITRSFCNFGKYLILFGQSAGPGRFLNIYFGRLGGGGLHITPN